MTAYVCARVCLCPVSMCSCVCPCLCVYRLYVCICAVGMHTCVCIGTQWCQWHTSVSFCWPLVCGSYWLNVCYVLRYVFEQRLVHVCVSFAPAEHAKALPIMYIKAALCYAMRCQMQQSTLVTCWQHFTTLWGMCVLPSAWILNYVRRYVTVYNCMQMYAFWGRV